jgi:transcription antitermination factor NusG
LLHAEAWYAVWTRSHCERLVARQLSAKGFCPFLPEVPDLCGSRRCAGGLRPARVKAARVVSAPLFPGYLFVREALSKSRYIELLKVRGIVRVLEDGWTRLTPVPDVEIDAIQRLLDSGLPVSAHPHLREGDRVRVISGPLSGVDGLYLHDKPHKGRLVLSVDLLGRSVAAEVNADDVTPCR